MAAVFNSSFESSRGSVPTVASRNFMKVGSALLSATPVVT